MPPRAPAPSRVLSGFCRTWSTASERQCCFENSSRCGICNLYRTLLMVLARFCTGVHPMLCTDVLLTFPSASRLAHGAVPSADCPAEVREFTGNSGYTLRSGYEYWYE